MKLLVKEKAFSLHNTAIIKDENDMALYEISKKIVSLVNKITIKDMSGNVITYIEQEVPHMVPNYNVFINDKFAFSMKKELIPLKNNYILNNGYKVIGDFRMVNNVVYDNNNNQIASIKRTTGFIVIGGSDKYEIEFTDHNQKDMIIAIFAIIANEINRSSNT